MKRNMTIRKKVWLIYIVSVLLPVIVISVSNVYFTASVRSHVDKEINFLENTFTKDPVDRMIENIQNEITKSPNLLWDAGYVELLRTTLQMTPFEIEIYDDSRVVLSVEQEKFKVNSLRNSIRTGQFIDTNGHPYDYEVFVLRRIPNESYMTQFYKQLLRSRVMYLFLYGIIHFIFFRFALKTVFAPLTKMKVAANSIRDERYDEPLVYEGDDEVGEVFEAFEEMRLRIKESHHLQQQYEDNRKELIANISHDLKTPITAINGYVQGILDGVANTDEKLQSYIQTIAVYSRDMDTLIDDLSLLSKLDIDGIMFKFESVRMRSYINDCIEELSFDLEEKGVDLSTTYEIKDTTQVEIDGAQIKRVLNNIIFNAVNHFDKAHQILDVVLTETEDLCIVEIRDNGCGVPEDKLDQIFDRFYRVDTSRNSETGGSGLGLSIARKIVQAHGGDIWAESQVGLGTKITFSVKKILEV